MVASSSGEAELGEWGFDGILWTEEEDECEIDRTGKGVSIEFELLVELFQRDVVIKCSFMRLRFSYLPLLIIHREKKIIKIKKDILLLDLIDLSYIN